MYQFRTMVAFRVSLFVKHRRKNREILLVQFLSWEKIFGEKRKNCLRRQEFVGKNCLSILCQYTPAPYLIFSTSYVLFVSFRKRRKWYAQFTYTIHIQNYPSLFAERLILQQEYCNNMYGSLIFHPINLHWS